MDSYSENQVYIRTADKIVNRVRVWQANQGRANERAAREVKLDASAELYQEIRNHIRSLDVPVVDRFALLTQVKKLVELANL